MVCHAVIPKMSEERSLFECHIKQYLQNRLLRIRKHTLILLKCLKDYAFYGDLYENQVRLERKLAISSDKVLKYNVNFSDFKRQLSHYTVLKSYGSEWKPWVFSHKKSKHT